MDWIFWESQDVCGIFILLICKYCYIHSNQTFELWFSDKFFQLAMNVVSAISLINCAPKVPLCFLVLSKWVLLHVLSLLTLSFMPLLLLSFVQSVLLNHLLSILYCTVLFHAVLISFQNILPFSFVKSMRIDCYVYFHFIILGKTSSFQDE